MGTKKLSGARKVFFTRCTCFESNFCPPRFLNLINSPRLNCKDSPRTSSALALNYADISTGSGWENLEETMGSSHDFFGGNPVNVPLLKSIEYA